MKRFLIGEHRVSFVRVAFVGLNQEFLTFLMIARASSTFFVNDS